MAANALEIVSLAAMEQELQLGSFPVDDPLTQQITNHIGAAVSMIDPLVRFSLIDTTDFIHLAIPYQEFSPMFKAYTLKPTTIQINYWENTEAPSGSPISLPTGVINNVEVDSSGDPFHLLLPGTAGWPTGLTYPYIRVTYSTGIAANDIPQAIKQAVILLTH